MAEKLLLGLLLLLLGAVSVLAGYKLGEVSDVPMTPAPVPNRPIELKVGPGGLQPAATIEEIQPQHDWRKERA